VFGGDELVAQLGGTGLGVGQDARERAGEGRLGDRSRLLVVSFSVSTAVLSGVVEKLSSIDSTSLTSPVFQRMARLAPSG
jgi:hypothetical protein